MTNTGKYRMNNIMQKNRTAGAGAPSFAYCLDDIGLNKGRYGLFNSKYFMC